MESELRPRLCFLTKGASGYGFHLHGERNKGGQFIRKVEAGSPADLSGLRAGDRIVEVNGENVESETHHQVVRRIQAVSRRARLLVVDRLTDERLSRAGLRCSEEHALELGNLSPRPSPFHTPNVSPVPRGEEGEPPAPGPALVAAPPRGAVQMLARARGRSQSPGRSPSPVADAELPAETSALPAATAELLPRVCHMARGATGFGFNLHSNKARPGQFVRSVDPASPAETAGLRTGDRLVEVDRVNVEGLRHSEVVALIQGGAGETRLLVVDTATDELFKRLGVTPTESHVKEVYVDEPITEALPPVQSKVYVDEPITEALPTVPSEVYVDEPITNIAPPTPPQTASVGPPAVSVVLTDQPIASDLPKSRTYGSSASQSSSGSTTQSEFSSDMSIQVPDDDERRPSDPFLESGLRLSPTAAEAKEKARAKRTKKRAPPMDWTKRQQVFSNF